MTIHLVRCEASGALGFFGAPDSIDWRRGMRVICQTDHGQEVGELLASLDDERPHVDGILIRVVTDADDRQMEENEQLRNTAFSVCDEALQEAGSRALLVDVEIPFEGSPLNCHLIGDIQDVQQIVAARIETMCGVPVSLHSIRQGAAGACNEGSCCASELPGGVCAANDCHECPAVGKCHKNV